MALTVKGIDGKKEPGRYGDGDGLWLDVSKTGRKAWSLRFMLRGRARQMGLGAYPAVSLSGAREKAAEARKLLAARIDPLEKRREAEGARKGEATAFKVIAEALIVAHEPTWRNHKSAAQWRASLRDYVYPIIGDIRVADISVDDVLRCLTPIWIAKPETADRVRGRIEKVLDAAAARKLRTGDNPARWRGCLEALLPKRTGKQAVVTPHRALPYADLPAFMRELRAVPGVAARALAFTIMTAARSGEALGATWAEIDIGAATWTIPADRMKSYREHRVPLSGAALDLLARLPREGDFVFASARYGKRLSQSAFHELLRRMGRRDVTAHGFRSTFRDWAGETTGHPYDVCEMALAHAVGNETSRAYQRGDFLDKRRVLMDDWAAFCMSGPSDAKVVPLRRARSRTAL